MTALLSVPIYQKISLTSKVMEKKYCFIVCCHAILISSQLSLHGLVIKYHELHGFRIKIAVDITYSTIDKFQAVLAVSAEEPGADGMAGNPFIGKYDMVV